MAKKKISYVNNKIFEQNLEKNFEIFKSKKVLIDSYIKIYNLIDQNILPGSKNLEIGSGFGYSKKYIKNLFTSDYPKNKFVDEEINIYNISKEDNSIDNLIMIDVFHHLEYPNLAFKEINRVLNNNGNLIIADVYLGFFPNLIFKLFHHEPINFSSKILNSDKIPLDIKYFANQSYYKRIIVDDEGKICSKYFFKKKSYIWSDFRYILTGGFSKKQFLKDSKLLLIKKIDTKIFNNFLNLFSVRGLSILKNIK